MPRALQAKRAREMDKHIVLCTLINSRISRVSGTHVELRSTLSREVVASVSDEGCPPRCRVSRRNVCSSIIQKMLMACPSLDVRDRCAFRRRTSQLWFIDRTHCHRARETPFRPHQRGSRHHHTQTRKERPKPIMLLIRQGRFRRRHRHRIPCSPNPARQSSPSSHPPTTATPTITTGRAVSQVRRAAPCPSLDLRALLSLVPACPGTRRRE
jgi:hypothetical protein